MSRISQEQPSFFPLVNYCIFVTVHGNYNLPEMYEMDDYSECRRDNGLYCKFILKVFPESSDNEIWKIMEVSL